MLTFRRNANSKPWWILGAFLLPLLALPFTGQSPAIGLAMLALLLVLHVLEVPAAYRLGDGRPLKIFGVTMLLMIPAVIGDAAAAAYIVMDGWARADAAGHPVQCGTAGMALMMAAPVLSVAAHVIGGLTLSTLTALFQRFGARPRPNHA